MNNHLVSIITPTYNCYNYLSHTIESVIKQTYTNWELLLIDDCSTDHTQELLKEYVNSDNRIKAFYSDLNSGAAIVRNRGIEMAQGKYIAFLDSDDKWHPEKLSDQIAFMEKESLNFTFTNYWIEKDIEKPFKFKTIKSVVFYNDILQFNYIPCSTVIFNQQNLGKQFMPNIRARQDWGLWMKLIELNGSAQRLDDYLMTYVIRNNSISSNKLKVIKYHWFIYYKHLKFNFFKAAYFFANNLYLHYKYKRR